MSLQVATLTRSFRYAGVTLPDPGSSLSPDSVRDLYTAHYPELATATVEGPEQQGASSSTRSSVQSAQRGRLRLPRYVLH